MARHADPPDGQLGKLSNATACNEAETDETEADETADGNTAPVKRGLRQRVSTSGAAIAIGLVAAVSVGGLGGWLGYQAYQGDETHDQRAMFVQAGRQAALNLTTINYTEADADIRRILDSATGAFHDDFQKRSQPFIDVVKQAQSKSEGTVTEAALESQHADQAQVLVAVSVKTFLGAAPQQDAQPRAWRMRIGLQQVGQVAKVSDVQFVP